MLKAYPDRPDIENTRQESTNVLRTQIHTYWGRLLIERGRGDEQRSPFRKIARTPHASFLPKMVFVLSRDDSTLQEQTGVA